MENGKWKMEIKRRKKGTINIVKASRGGKEKEVLWRE